jgi:hypothetical protein
VKRGRALWALGALALVVGALVWWDLTRPAGDPDRLVPGLDRARLSTITIVRDGATVKLQRDGAAWKLDGIRADGDAVDQLLGALEFEKVERRVQRDDALMKQAGLASPRLTVEVGRTRLAIGGDAPGGRASYVGRGREILVVDHRLRDVADLPPSKWRLVRPLLSDTGAIQSLAVGDVKIERAGDGWTVDGKPAAPRAVDQLLDAVDRARGELRSPSKKEAGVAIAVNGVVEARVAGRCDRGPALARSDGAMLCFDDAALAPLFQPAAKLIEPRLFPLTVDAITDVDLRGGEKRLALHRESAMWRIVAPLDAAGPADDASVRAWLDELVALTDEGGPQKLTVRGAGGSFSHAVRDQPIDPLRFHDRRLIDLRADELERLTVDGYTLQRQRHGGAADTFEIDPPVPVDDEDVRALFDAFAQLRAQSFDREQRPATRTISGAGRTLHLHDCAGELGGLSFTLDEPTCHALSLPLGR